MADAASQGRLMRAEQLLDAGRAQEAASILSEALREDPSSAPVLRLLSAARAASGRPAEAVRLAESACAIDPDNLSSQLRLVHALQADGQGRRAQEVARGAVRTWPHSWQSHYTLASALLDAPKDARSALVAASVAFELAPHSPEPHNVAGMALSALGRKQEARAAYERALAIDPQHSLALNNLAVLDIGEGGNLRRGGRALSSALALDPQRQLLHRNLEAWLLTFLRKGYYLLLPIAVILGVECAGDQPAPYAVRALTGVVLLGGLAVVGWRSWRVLPRGTHRWLPGFIRGLRSVGQWFALIVMTVLLLNSLVLAFAPAGVARSLGLALFGLWYYAVIIGVVVRGVVSVGRRLGRRG